MLAAIFSLLFQSTFISDGLVEYMTFIRGGIVVGGQMVKQHLKIVFSNLNVAQPPSKEVDAEEGMINDAPTIQKDVVLGAVRSLEICEELCSTRLERRVHAALMTIARSLVVSSTHGLLHPAGLKQLTSRLTNNSISQTPRDVWSLCDANDTYGVPHFHITHLTICANLQDSASTFRRITTGYESGCFESSNASSHLSGEGDWKGGDRRVVDFFAPRCGSRSVKEVLCLDEVG